MVMPRLCTMVVRPSLNYATTVWSADIFNLHNPFGHAMDLDMTEPLTEMSTRNIIGAQRADGA
jgi:hypothetical protein